MEVSTMKKILSLVLLSVLLLTTLPATALGADTGFDLNVFYKQLRPDGSGNSQYSVSIDDMEARGFISLNKIIWPDDDGYSFDYINADMWLYTCSPDIYLANYGTSKFYPLPRIWFEYNGKDLYTYDTAIFKIGDTTYTFNDINVSYDTSNWSRDTKWKSKSVCLCDSSRTAFMDAWIANGTALIKVRLKGNKHSLDFNLPKDAQADTLLMFKNFKDAGGYSLLPTLK